MKNKFKIGKKSFLQMAVEIKKVNRDDGSLEAVFSTQDVDRHGDTIVQSGWDLKNFLKNPVIINSHNYGDATEVVGRATDVRIEGKKLVGKIIFAVNENPKAKIIFDLYAGKFLSAFSVGFMPLKFKEEKGGQTNYYVIEEAELFEVSAVSVPANARALAKAKGLDVDILDEEEEPEEKINIKEPKENEEEPEEKKDGDNTNVQKGDEAKEDDEPEPKEQGGDNEDRGEESHENNEDVETRSVKKSKIISAIKTIQKERKRKILKVLEILNDIVSGDEKNLDKETKEKIENRKLNKAVRMLVDSK